MITETCTTTTTALYNSDKSERYCITKIWQTESPITSLLMINAGAGNEVVIDMTSLYCIRNLHALGYGGYEALNLSSVIAESLNTKELTLSEINVQEILKSIERTGQCIICWGKIGESNSKVAAVQRELLKCLESVKDKLYTIVTDAGANWHPIAPQIRHEWRIARFERPGYLEEEPEDEPEEPEADATSEPTAQATEKPTKNKQSRKNSQTA